MLNVNGKYFVNINQASTWQTNSLIELNQTLPCETVFLIQLR